MSNNHPRDPVMNIFNTHSIIFKTTLLYFFLTILNSSFFIMMVFENQLDLISENAILNCQHSASNLKYRIDNKVSKVAHLTATTINAIIKEAEMLHIGTLTLYGENGKIFVCIENSRIVDKTMASADELRMIHLAITKQGFENKMFYHTIHRREKTITLFLPFAYASDKIAVAGIKVAMNDIERQMGYLYRQGLILGIIVMAVHFGFALLFSKMVLLPLRQLNAATHMIAHGKLEIRVPIVRNDEIGQLASSFNEMSISFQRMRDEAKGSNPLTGLPGNISIANYINGCLENKKIICVLYCDLDNFKSYNDKYGFSKGDEAILYTRDCLMSAAKRIAPHEVYIGHEGGDDFVVVTNYEQWETYVKAFIATFDRGIPTFYNSTDARNGYIESVNRRRERQRFPLMSVSVAVVSNKMRDFGSIAEMIQVAAEIKKYVKSMEGSCYAIDRRTGPISARLAIAPQQPADKSPTEYTARSHDL